MQTPLPGSYESPRALFFAREQGSGNNHSIKNKIGYA